MEQASEDTITTRRLMKTEMMLQRIRAKHSRNIKQVMFDEASYETILGKADHSRFGGSDWACYLDASSEIA